MPKQELDVQMMSLADLRVVAEVAGDISEHYKKEGLDKQAADWAYNKALCINALEHRIQEYFKR